MSTLMSTLEEPNFEQARDAIIAFYTRMSVLGASEKLNEFAEEAYRSLSPESLKKVTALLDEAKSLSNESRFDEAKAKEEEAWKIIFDPRGMYEALKVWTRFEP